MTWSPRSSSTTSMALILKDGKVVDSIVGVQPKDRYTEALEQLISAEGGEEMPGDGQPADEHGSPS